MANFWKVNQQTTNGTIRYWDMVETMLAALWTMPNSGDGLTLGVPVTHGGTGAGGLGNNNAWVRLQDPSGPGGREIIIQRKTANTTWDLVYSPSANFTGGSPTQTVRPTATDQGLIINNVAIHSTADSLHHCWASNVAPYPFYLFAYPIVGGNYNHLTMMDEIETLGTDTDNIIFVRGLAGTMLDMGGPSEPWDGSGGLCAWGTAAGNFVPWLMYFLWGSTTQSGLQGFMVTDVPPMIGSSVDLIGPAFFFRRTSNVFFKGRSKNFKQAGFNRPSSGTTYTVISTRDRIYLKTGSGAVVLPWNGVIPTFP